MLLFLSRAGVPYLWISAGLLSYIDRQNATEVILCLKKSQSFHFYPFGTQLSCKGDWGRLLKNEKPWEVEVHLFLKGLGWFDFLKNIASILKWKCNNCVCERRVRQGYDRILASKVTSANTQIPEMLFQDWFLMPLKYRFIFRKINVMFLREQLSQDLG